jgi:hypothetical protein
MTTMLTDNEKAALLDSVIQRVRADLNDGKPLTEMRDHRLVSLATVRAAIADVLDAGYQFKNHAKPCPWLFFHDESDEQTEIRSKFLNAVCQRIAQLQQPPHNMDAERLVKERL